MSTRLQRQRHQSTGQATKQAVDMTSQRIFSVLDNILLQSKRRRHKGVRVENCVKIVDFLTLVKTLVRLVKLGLVKCLCVQWNGDGTGY